MCFSPTLLEIIWYLYLFFCCQTFNELQKLISKTHGQVVGDLMTPSPLVVRGSTNLEDAARYHSPPWRLWPQLIVKKKSLTTSCLQVATGNKVQKVTSREFRWKTGERISTFSSSFLVWSDLCLLSVIGGNKKKDWDPNKGERCKGCTADQAGNRELNLASSWYRAEFLNLPYNSW